MTNVQNLVRFFLNGFSQLDLSETEIAAAMPETLDALLEPEFEVADGSWVATFKQHPQGGYLCSYGDSGGNQGETWVREGQHGAYITIGLDWERCFGTYGPNDQGEQILQILWEQDSIGNWEGGQPHSYGAYDVYADEDDAEGKKLLDFWVYGTTNVPPFPKADSENGPSEDQPDPIDEYKNRRTQDFDCGETAGEYHEYVVALADKAVEYAEYLLAQYNDPELQDPASPTHYYN